MNDRGFLSNTLVCLNHYIVQNGINRRLAVSQVCAAPFTLMAQIPQPSHITKKGTLNNFVQPRIPTPAVQFPLSNEPYISCCVSNTNYIRSARMMSFPTSTYPDPIHDDEAVTEIHENLKRP